MGPRVASAVVGSGLIIAVGLLLRAQRTPELDGTKVVLAGAGRETEASSVTPVMSRTSAPAPPLVKDGKALFKVVMVGYSGVCAALNGALASLPIAARESWRSTEDSAWLFCGFHFDLEAERWRDLPVQLHVFGHEGIGFIGQPGSAKDVVFKGVHAIFGLASAPTEAHDLDGVLESDLLRLHSQGAWPISEIIIAPATGTLPQQAWKGRTLESSQALALLLTGVPDMLPQGD